MMKIDDWFDEEMKALEKQRDNCEISEKQFQLEVLYLRQDADEQETIEAMKQAGRGHLLR